MIKFALYVVCVHDNTMAKQELAIATELRYVIKQKQQKPNQPLPPQKRSLLLERESNLDLSMFCFSFYSLI
jgi:hypothetical protein